MVKRLTVYSAALLVFVYALYSLYRIASSLAPDFSVFYDAARGLVAYKNIYTLPMYTGLGYPPFTLLPFLPFTLLGYPLAQTVWVILSFGFFLAAIYLFLSLVRTRVKFIEFCVVFILAFMAFPTKFTLGMGQVNFAALFFLGATLVAWKWKKQYVAGLFFGLLLILKPHFLLLLPVVLLTTTTTVASVSLLTLGAGALVTGLVYGWSLYAYYFQVTVPPLLTFAGRSVYYNQGLGSFFSRSLPVSLSADLTQWVSVLLGVVCLWWIWARRLKFMESVMVAIPVLLFIEPLSWQHHYVFLLPVYIWLVSKVKKSALDLVFTAVSFVLVAINIPDPDTIQRLPFSALILSHVFLGNVLLLYPLYRVSHETT